MIVRIISEGQYRVGSALLDELNAIDADIVTAVGREDETQFRQLLGKLLSLVREQGKPLAADELVASDIMLPPPDTTLGEAKAIFVGDGAIPG